VVANLNAATLLDLAGEIDRVRAPGAPAVISGFRDRDLARIERVFRFASPPVEKDGWLAGIVEGRLLPWMAGLESRAG
jgi:hypothetical protein